jgi:hypothetical protein
VLSGHDRYLENAAAKLMRDESAAGRARIAVPEVVLIEANANHRRDVRKARDAYMSAREALERLRAPQSDEDIRPLRRYRDDLEHIVLEAGGEILPMPTVRHVHLVQKAADRQRPFDLNGDGYRDALVWETVLELLGRSPERVMLVSQDRAAFARAKDKAELARELVDELRDRGHAGRAQLYFDLKVITAEIPQVHELAGLWRHKITDNAELRDALIQELLEVAYADATNVIGAEVREEAGTVRNAQFVAFSNPRDRQVQEAWTSRTGSVLLDVELTIDYRLEYETLLRALPLPQSGPYEWTQVATSGSIVLTYEVIQHEPEVDPTNFAARLTAWTHPGQWPFEGKWR